MYAPLNEYILEYNSENKDDRLYVIISILPEPIAIESTAIFLDNQCNYYHTSMMNKSFSSISVYNQNMTHYRLVKVRVHGDYLYITMRCRR